MAGEKDRSPLCVATSGLSYREAPSLVTTKRNVRDGIHFKITGKMIELMIQWNMFLLDLASGCFYQLCPAPPPSLRWDQIISSHQW